MPHVFIAIDLGAESGRVVHATLGDDAIALREVHRFPTQGLVMHGVRQWDVTRIYEEILVGLTRAAQVDGPTPEGTGIDTWGVDFGLIASDGALVGNPVHYRDRRTEGMIEAVGEVVPLAELYARTGVMALPFNTLYQLLALVRAGAPALRIADRLLFMGPLLGYLLAGRVTCETTIASTSQMLSAETGDWDRELLARLGIPTHFLPEITPPGTVVGPILDDVARATGLDSAVPYISTAVHDTACAVAAVPVEAEEGDWAFLSSGTWSLMGAELDAPITTAEALEAGFTNERGACGTVRFLKTIFGLWLVQECRRAWLAESGGEENGLEYGALAEAAEAAEPFRSVIGLEDPRLFAPESMPAAIRAICAESGVPEPRTRGEYVRCALESLALTYRRALAGLDRLTGRTTRRLHIVGGGVQNGLLCQLTADACGIPVHAGPVEATALGNVLVQGMATGALPSLAAGRALVRRSQPVAVYAPRPEARWAALDGEVAR